MKGIFPALMFSVSVLYGFSPRIQSTTVKYLSGRDTVTGYLSTQAGDRIRPALIVIHEWWGLNDWVKENARALAEQGYVTLAVDLYRGKSAASPDEAHELMRGLPEDRAARDLVAAFQFLRSQPNVDTARIGAIGWCMGGGYSLVSALQNPGLAASVICYGRLVTDSSTIANIPCPLLGIFGGKDRGIPPEDVRAFESAVKRAGKSIQVAIYPDAGHAFMNPNNKGNPDHGDPGYRKDDAADAWKKIDAFLRQNLKTTPSHEK